MLPQTRSAITASPRFPSKLPVISRLLYQVKPALDQQEIVAVCELKLHVELMVFHPSVNDELVIHRALKRQVCLPVFVSAFGKHQGFVRQTDCGPVINERTVYPLQGNQLRIIEDGATPARIVCKKRRARLAVNRHLSHLPDSVKC